MKHCAALAGGELTQLNRVAVAAVAGGTSALVSTPAELLMIQQQRSGDSLPGAARRVVNTYGIRRLYRGFVRFSPHNGIDWWHFLWASAGSSK